MLRTIATRLTGTKGQLQAAADEGLDVQDAIENQSKYRDEIFAETKGAVDILKEDGKTYKSTFEILKELSEVWSKLDADARAVIIADAAGTRGANVFTSLMENFPDAVNAAKDASGAMNELREAQEIYSDSIEGKLKKLSSSFTAFSNDVLDSQVVKSLVDLATAFVNAADGAVKLAGSIPGIATALSAVLTLTNTKAGKVNMPSYAHC